MSFSVVPKLFDLCYLKGRVVISAVIDVFY